MKNEMNQIHSAFKNNFHLLYIFGGERWETKQAVFNHFSFITNFNLCHNFKGTKDFQPFIIIIYLLLFKYHIRAHYMNYYDEYIL